jgi:hypothetical protein
VRGEWGDTYCAVDDCGCNVRRFASGGGGNESESAMMQWRIAKAVSMADDFEFPGASVRYEDSKGEAARGSHCRSGYRS